MMLTAHPIVIVGAGQAGLQVAESLRGEGWEGEVILLGDEPHAPYHRPPLSKAYLMGEATATQLTMRSPEALARKNISLRTGIRVERIDREKRELHLSDGGNLSYHRLVLATGARARSLAGTDLAGVFSLRGIDDCRQIANALETAENVVVIGGGFIGLEFAAVARKKGKGATVIEAGERLMARAVSPFISEWFARLHVDHGVRVCMPAQIDAFVGENGRVRAIHLADGTHIPADLVVLGIGVVPNDELAEAAGLQVERGIVVDDCGRTADTAIFAAGDCTATRRPDGSLRRLESVQNAVEQAKAVAAAVLGREKPFLATPWFWSDQHGVKLQMVGTSAGNDSMVLRGNMADRKFSAFYFRDSRLIGIVSINCPQDHMLGRKLLDHGVSLTPEQAADETLALNSLLA
jgi:3-phenylpropionate/trans-cinnamate dioxygenase ferredoxin reductase subunit